MKPSTSLLAAMVDPQLFGKVFATPSFWSWRTVAKLIDGTTLTESREIELFKQCTGRSELLTTTARRKPARRIILLVGRRGGKDRFLSGVAVWRAALCTDWRRHVSAGEAAVVLLIGADRKQAAILRRYAHGLLQVPLLRAEVRRETDDVIEFRNGASLEIVTNDVRLVRGRSAIAVLGSECAHWRTDEHASSSDEEVVAAAQPSMAMCPDGGLLLLGSSVFRKRGYMYRKYKELHGDDTAEDICWLAPSAVINPKLPTHVVERALAEDPAKARSEYLSEWREDVVDFIPLDVVEAATDWRIRERPPRPNVKYIAYCDAAGGTGQDAFTLCIASREGDIVFVDVIRERKPRFVPAAVIAEFAELLRSYRIREVSGDKFAGGFHADEWKRNGITYRSSANTTSENYLAALPLLLSGRVRLVDNEPLRRQLVGLERRVLPSGRESVSHAAVSSAHDDVAAAVCGGLVTAQAANKRRLLCGSYGYGGGPVTWWDAKTGQELDPRTLEPIERTRIRFVTVPEALAPAARGKF